MLAKQQASVIMERILQAHDQRSLLFTRYQDTITAFKQSKDVQAFRKAKKALDDKFKSCTETIARLSKDLQAMEPEGHAKVRGGGREGGMWPVC